MMPPLGSILIGPCPLCREMVVLFSGKVMALDKNVMLGDDTDAKKVHLTDVLNGYLAVRIDEVLSGADLTSFDVDEGADDAENGEPEMDEIFGDEVGGQDSAETTPLDKFADVDPISKEEAEDFLRIDLPLLARDKYFRMFFQE